MAYRNHSNCNTNDVQMQSSFALSVISVCMEWTEKPLTASIQGL